VVKVATPSARRAVDQSWFDKRRRGSTLESVGSEPDASDEGDVAERVLDLLCTSVQLRGNYAVARADLYRAGLEILWHPAIPGWFCAQRVIVAALRTRLVQIETALAQLASPHRRWGETALAQLASPHRRWGPAELHRLLSLEEAETLHRLQERAREKSQTRKKGAKPSEADRKRLEALAAAWQHDADILIGNLS
jgi:hypothetical protein